MGLGDAFGSVRPLLPLPPIANGKAALGYPFNRSIPAPFSTGGSPVAAPSSAGAHARVVVLAGLSAADGWR